MNDFVGNILQNKFYAYGYIFLSRPKRRCTPICGADMLLRCNWCRNLDAVNCILPWIVLTLSTLHTRNTRCITLLWLHHNHKMTPQSQNVRCHFVTKNVTPQSQNVHKLLQTRISQ